MSLETHNADFSILAREVCFALLFNMGVKRSEGHFLSNLTFSWLNVVGLRDKQGNKHSNKQATNLEPICSQP